MSAEEPAHGPIVLGRRTGVAGESSQWRIVHWGRERQVDRRWLVRGLKAGWLTGVEQVRRADGDWGPLFGRPPYREVFASEELEPRDHARARARARITRLGRVTWATAIGALLAVGLGLPGLGTALWTEGMLLVAAGLGVTAGLSRLVRAIATAELDQLRDRLVQPVTPPPEPVDWARKAADDEVDAFLKRPASEAPRAEEG